jgi:hypothetical protein
MADFSPPRHSLAASAHAYHRKTPHIIPHLAARCKGKIEESEESRGAGAESDGKSDMCNGKSAPIQRMFGTYPTEEEKSLTRLGTKGYVTLQPKVG